MIDKLMNENVQLTKDGDGKEIETKIEILTHTHSHADFIDFLILMKL